MLKEHPIGARFLLFVVIPILTIGLAAFLHLRGSLPAAGKTSLAGVDGQPVTLTRDAHGVLSVDARTDSDAFFALGYAHAQDRLWQLEVQRRIASGRLSEIFGSATLPQDAFMRTLDLYGSAESAWLALSPEAQASLRAYAAGINAWLKAAPVLPPEFLMLGVKPKPWTEMDSLAWSKVFALDLAGNMKQEASNLVASQYLDKQALADLLHLSSGDLAAAASLPMNTGKRALDGLLALEQQRESLLKIGGPFIGSNAWVLSGRLTEDGAPLLANDAHLGLQIPSLWYVAHLKGDRLDVAGMTLVGLPIVVFGHNREIAWGGTSMMADVQDLYLEQVKPDDPTLYRQASGWSKFDSHVEEIAVRADFPSSLRTPLKPVQLQVRRTSHGPIVSDELGVVEQPVALRWTALEPGDASYESFYRLDYAHDWNDFRAAMRTFVAPALNLLYADRSGNIGSLGVGRIPIRSKGIGRIPVPGWSDDYTWTGYIPFEQWPQRFNPKQGYIVSANDRNVDADYPYFISADWAPPERAERIAQMIDAEAGKGQRLTIADVQRMQADVTDLGAGNLAAFLRAVPTRSDSQRRAQAYLRDWQGDMGRQSQAATIYTVWTRHLREEVFGRRLHGYWNKPQQSDDLAEIAASTTDAQLLDALTNAASPWCDHAHPSDDGSCTTLALHALDSATDELEKLKGANMDSWRWGNVHSTVYAHLPFSQMGVLGLIFERRIANGGSGNTVDVASAAYRESVGYEQYFGAGFRQIIRMGDGSVTDWYMNSTGQSGNVFSAHYDDMIKRFRDVQYFTLDQPPMSAAAGPSNLARLDR